MSNEIFKTGDVVEVMPSHAQTWKNNGKIAIGHRFIIENAKKWKDGYEHCEGAVQKFEQNYRPRDLKIVERNGKPYIDERWGMKEKENIFKVGDEVIIKEEDFLNGVGGEKGKFKHRGPYTVESVNASFNCIHKLSGIDCTLAFERFDKYVPLPTRAISSKFNIGDRVETCKGGWFFCEPRPAKYFVNDTFNTGDCTFPKTITEIIQSEDGMYWYMLNDCGNYISEGGLKLAEKKEEPENTPVPVEKKKFNVGDWVKCVKIENNSPADAGWQENLVFQITKIYHDNTIALGGRNGNGVYLTNLTHASTNEIPNSMPFTFEEPAVKPTFKEEVFELYVNSKPFSGISIKSIDSVQTKLIKKKSRVLF